MKVFVIANNKNEARVIVGILQSHPDITEGWEDGWYELDYPMGISVHDKYPYPIVDCEKDEFTEITIDDLVKLALNGFELPKWIPKKGEEYWYPAINSEDYMFITNNDDAGLDQRMIERGLACKTMKEAVARAKHMLRANRDFVKGE